MALNNEKIDNFPNPGNPHLHQFDIGAAGDHSIVSLDTTALIKSVAKVHTNGDYSSEITDHDGNKNTVIHGGEKHAADSKTSTITGHSDTSIGGGDKQTNNQGTHQTTASSSTTAAAGPSIEASGESKKSLSEGGNGIHAMSGDQSFINDTGGIHYDVAKDFSVTAKGSMIHLNSDNEISVYAGGNEGHTGKTFTINSTDMIQFVCGSSTITMLPGKITITASAIEFIKA